MRRIDKKTCQYRKSSKLIELNKYTANGQSKKFSFKNMIIKSQFEAKSEKILKRFSMHSIFFKLIELI